jgi:hypothetical protein
VSPVFGDGQSDQPEKVYEQKGPVDRHQKNLKTRAQSGSNGYEHQTLPKVELIDGSQHRTVSFCAPENGYAFLEEEGVFSFILIGIWESRGSIVLYHKVDYVESDDVHET